MRRVPWIAVPLILLVSCGSSDTAFRSERKAVAERFFRGVYGGDVSVVDELAAPDIVVSYPIFQELFNTPVIKGREATKEFARGFAQRWADASVTIHEAIAEDDQVVIVWSFRARNVGSARSDQPPSNQEEAWGGITLYRFNPEGEIAVEVGEESEPGPHERLSGETPQS